MGDILFLGDGRGWHASSALFSRILKSAALLVPGDQSQLRAWLHERADEPPGLMSFDLRSFDDDVRLVVESAIRDGVAELRECDPKLPSRAILLIKMMDAVARGEPPGQLNDLNGIAPFTRGQIRFRQT